MPFNFDLTILGSGAAMPSPKRYATAHALNVHGRVFLVDCAEGTQTQLLRNRIKTAQLDHVFISHLHGDHVLGLPGLISTFSLAGRTSPLNVHAPPMLQELLELLYKVLGPPTFPVLFHPLQFDEPRLILDDHALSVTSFPLSHRVPTCGFRFDEKPFLANIRPEVVRQFGMSPNEIRLVRQGQDLPRPDRLVPNPELAFPPRAPRSYAFCSDTLFHPPLAGWVRGVDLLYHEATFASHLVERANQTGHSTAAQAATIAQMAGVRQLLIGHFSLRYQETGVERLLAEAQEIFPNTTLAQDNLRVELPFVQRPNPPHDGA